MNMVIMHLSVLKRSKSTREIISLEKDRDCLYVNEDNDSDEQGLSDSDDEIGFVPIK